MPRTALLIGSETYGLTGVGNDLETMADQLTRRGFATLRCTGPQATRAGILDSYERLIRDTRHGDAVVVYYSGHGGLAGPPPALALYGRAAPPRLQFIVPTDYAESTESDFRGITAPELSVLLVRLTDATPNVTVVLDTCHAAHMSRDEDLRVKALVRPAYVDIAEHLSRQRHQGLDTTVRHVLGNQDAVRIVACGPEQSAYEYTNGAGRRIGILTESIALALAEPGGRPVTWAGVMREVRRRVQTMVPQQRPEAEGPALRPLFQADATRPSGTDQWRVPDPAGRALGAPVTIEWGQVVGGRAHPLPAADAVVHAGDRVYVRVRSDGDTAVHISLIGIDVESQISLVTSLDPSGIALRPGEECVVGRDELDGRLVGIPLLWPPGVERDVPRPAAFVVLVSSAPRDVRAPVAGTYRDLDVSEGGAVHRDVHRIPFRLDPGRARSRSPILDEG
jgi:hypothetical protein